MVGHNRALRFCRWCRKGYAVFVSLGRCVTIGRLCREIADRSLCKQQNALGLALLFTQSKQIANDEEMIVEECPFLNMQGITMPFSPFVYAIKKNDYQEYNIKNTRFS